MGRLENNALLGEIRRVLRDEAKEISMLQDKLNDQTIIEVLHLIEDCKGKVILSACGTSGTAAQKIAHTLSCIEVPALFLSPATALHGGMGVVQSEDLLILISKGGHTWELEKIAAACSKKGTKIIAVTENLDTFLSDTSDIVLQVRVDSEPDSFGMLATASTLSVIAVFDAIAIAIAEDKGYTKEEFLLIHPGGEVGEKLAQQTQGNR